MWRLAESRDDDAIVAMCQALNDEDPCEAPVPAAHVRRTLAALRREPLRGLALVLDLGASVLGYALLISFWSNELGGEVCVLDELYVRPGSRSHGHAQALVRSLLDGAGHWPQRPVALELEVSPRNERAHALYERLGFAPIRNTRMRLHGPHLDTGLSSMPRSAL